jgi:hypothetical protein
MELINSTRMVAGYTMGIEPSGRELLIVVVKGTFGIPTDEGPVRLADEQVPLVTADTFTGEPGFSAPEYEVDFAPKKRRCDVLVVGSGYAPGGRPTTHVRVSVELNGLAKAFTVVGDREWRMGIAGASITRPRPFTVMPISYDRAFGGIDYRHENSAKHAAFMRNPVGRGFHKHLRSEWLDGSPLPNTEESHRPIAAPDVIDYVPMSLGPIGRGWEPRSGFAGTYDEAWLDEHFPFLPPDFDDAYYQAAPADQQVAHPQGGEQVILTNLTPVGRSVFRLPTFDAPVHFFPKKGPREDARLTLDTIVLEPDRQRFTLTWRAARPLMRNIFELAQVMVGKKSDAWWAMKQTIEFPIILGVVRSRKFSERTDEPVG